MTKILTWTGRRPCSCNFSSMPSATRSRVSVRLRKMMGALISFWRSIGTKQIGQGANPLRPRMRAIIDLLQMLVATRNKPRTRYNILLFIVCAKNKNKREQKPLYIITTHEAFTENLLNCIDNNRDCTMPRLTFKVGPWSCPLFLGIVLNLESNDWVRHVKQRLEKDSHLAKVQQSVLHWHSFHFGFLMEG